MTHDVSLTYSRFEHMPPTALALATLLHGLVALALFWISPLRPIEQFEDAIEITMEAPVPTPPQAAAEQPSPPPSPPPAQSQPAAAAQQPSGPPMRLGLPPPAPSTDQRGTPGVEAPSRQATDTPTPDKTQQTSDKEEKEPPAQQQALAQPAPPPPPPPPTLEQALPPVDLPPPPVTERDVPRPAPAARPAPPPHQAQRPPPPPPQHQPAQRPPQQQGLRPSPLGQAPQQRTPTERQAAARPPSATFHNPADNYGQRRAEEQYLWQVMRRIAQFPYVPKNTSTIREEGTVLTRVTIARDGRLLGVVLERSSGLASLDAGVLETIRRASPYPPLPTDIPGDRHSFLLPVSFRYNQAR